MYRYVFKNAQEYKPEGIGIRELNAYRLQIIKDCDLLSVVHKESEDNVDFHYPSDRIIRNGHMAFNTVLGNIINEISQKPITETMESGEKELVEYI